MPSMAIIIIIFHQRNFKFNRAKTTSAVKKQLLLPFQDICSFASEALSNSMLVVISMMVVVLLKNKTTNLRNFLSVNCTTSVQYSYY